MSEGGRDPRRRTEAAFRPRLASAESPYLWLPILVAVGLLLFLVGPLGSEIQEPIDTIDRVLIYAGVAVFVAVYLWAIPADLAGRGRGRAGPATVVLALLAVGISLLDRGPDWTVCSSLPRRPPADHPLARRRLAAIVVTARRGARDARRGRPVAGAVESAFEVALWGSSCSGSASCSATARQLEQTRRGRRSPRERAARIARDMHDSWAKPCR